LSAFRLTPKAQKDLDGIWEYSVEQWGAARAERYIRRLKAVLERVAARPESAKACEDIRPGYRRASAGSHIIFFKVGEDYVEIVRILHAQMDFARRL
jgi:toxin ParE1/3/4